MCYLGYILYTQDYISQAIQNFQVQKKSEYKSLYLFEVIYLC